MKYLLVMFFLAISLQSQIKATTEQGKKSSFAKEYDKVILGTGGALNITFENGKVVESYDDSVFVDVTDLDCSQYTTMKTDKMTGKSHLYSKESIEITSLSKTESIIISTIYLGKGFISSHYEGKPFTSDNAFALNFKIIGAGNCVETKQVINFLFRDGSKLQAEHFGKFNCDATSTLIFEEGNLWVKALNELRSKEIETIRTWTKDGYVQLDLSPKESQNIINLLNCMILKIREI